LYAPSLNAVTLKYVSQKSLINSTTHYILDVFLTVHHELTIHKLPT